MELLGVLLKLLVQGGIDGAGRIRNVETRNVDEKLAVQGATAEEDREVIAATISKGIADTNFFAFDDAA